MLFDHGCDAVTLTLFLQVVFILTRAAFYYRGFIVMIMSYVMTIFLLWKQENNLTVMLLQLVEELSAQNLPNKL